MMGLQAFGAEIKHKRWPGRRRGLSKGKQPRLFDLCTQYQVGLPPTMTATKGVQREKICTIQKGWPHGEKDTRCFGRRTVQLAAMVLEGGHCPSSKAALSGMLATSHMWLSELKLMTM